MVQHHNHTSNTHQCAHEMSHRSFNIRNMREYVSIVIQPTHVVHRTSCLCVVLSFSFVTFNFSLNEFCDGIWFPCEPNARWHKRIHSCISRNKIHRLRINVNHFVSCRNQIADDSFFRFRLFLLSSIYMLSVCLFLLFCMFVYMLWNAIGCNLAVSSDWFINLGELMKRLVSVKAALWSKNAIIFYGIFVL